MVILARDQDDGSMYIRGQTLHGRRMRKQTDAKWMVARSHGIHMVKVVLKELQKEIFYAL